MNRIRRYIENAGPGQALISVVVLGYVLYMQARFAMSGPSGFAAVMVVGVPAVVIGLVGPRLFLSTLIENGAAVSRVMRIAWFVVMGYVVLVLLRWVPQTIYVSVPIMFAVFLFYGVQFWMLSDERVMTARSLHVVRGRQRER